MTEEQTPVEIFCSYANADEKWLRKLETHLSLLKRQGLISLWHDRLIAPGTDWTKTIDTHLETASVILLLVSADFFASDYCYGIEMQRALAREAADEARVIPILVRPVDWTTAPFAHLQSLPTDARPIISWQSTDTALADVAAGIRRVIVEELPQLPASAPRAALPKIWNVPYPRNPFFLGRDAELSQIRHHLLAGQTTALSQPQAISGLGGIGKTQLALEYAYHYYQDYTAVLWARAESTDALISSYVAIATLLRLPEREAQEQEITVQAVKTWLQTHQGWLLILDNADDLALLSNFLPSASAGHLLLTTRATATGRLARRLEIETLPPDQGALFLLQRAAFLAPNADLSHIANQQQELAMRISEELGGLPLALDQAGAYLEETGCSLADYQRLYQQHRDELLRKRGGLVADHPEPVATTWSISFQQAQKKNPATVDLLCVCAFLAPDVIPEEILTVGASALGSVLPPIAADPFQLNQTLEALRAYSLIRRNPTEKTLSIHRLVQAVLRDTLEETTWRIWAERAMLALNTVFPDNEFDHWLVCEQYISHVILFVQLSEATQITSAVVADLFNKAGGYLFQRGRYAEAKMLFQHALSIRSRLLGSQHIHTIRTLTNLADVTQQLGHSMEAEPLYRRLQSFLEQQLESQHSHLNTKDTIFILNQLATLYQKSSGFGEAEPLLQRALILSEQYFGPQHQKTAEALNDLAILYHRQGCYAEAELLYQRALVIEKQESGPEHPETAQILSNLAGIYEMQGKYAEAEQSYQRVLLIRYQTIGAKHHKTTETRTRLIALLHTMGRHNDAAKLKETQSG